MKGPIMDRTSISILRIRKGDLSSWMPPHVPIPISSTYSWPVWLLYWHDDMYHVFSHSVGCRALRLRAAAEDNVDQAGRWLDVVC